MKSLYTSTMMLISLGPLHPATKPISLPLGVVVMNLTKKQWDPLAKDGRLFFHDPFATPGARATATG